MAAVSVVVLTMGDRPVELATAIGSARGQSGVEVEIVMVVNGGDPDRSLADVVVEPGENLGIPGGRNVGIAAATTEFIAVLDDDACYRRADLLRRAHERFVADAALGVLGLHMVDEEGTTLRRHHPALRVDADVSTHVTSFPGCGWVVRREAFDEVGGLCDEFFYGLEETDLSWRLINRDWAVYYDADLTTFHPRTDPNRHSTFHHHTARNRVWLAHRSLPVPLGLLYVLNWTLITVLRNIGSWSAIRAHISGTIAGVRSPVGPREPMRWRTVWRLTKLGRPPII